MKNILTLISVYGGLRESRKSIFYFKKNLKSLILALKHSIGHHKKFNTSQIFERIKNKCRRKKFIFLISSKILFF